jgi:hypothetical protein
MKKLLGIIVLSLLMSGNAYAYDEHFKSKDLYVIAVGKEMPLSRNDAKGDEFWEKYYNEQIEQVSNYCKSQGKRFFKFNQDFKKGFYRKFVRIICAENVNEIKNVMMSGAYDWNKKSWKFTKNIFNRGLDNTNFFGSIDPDNAHVFKGLEQKIIANKEKNEQDKINEVKQKEKKERAEAIASGDISFTIKDKKEQCTAIGFEPATEKFADCVLRLVELDVKTQQTNQIALAQSQGNQQIADQLKKQRSDQSSQYFLDLSQKLLNPQSTVSAPSTSTCTISGGVYKNISCW